MSVSPDAFKIAPMRGAQLCKVEQILGRAAICPEKRCPFWEPGGAVLEGRCMFKRVDLRNDPGVAAWLLQIRTQLGVEEDEARRRLNRLLDEGQGE